MPWEIHRGAGAKRSSRRTRCTARNPNGRPGQTGGSCPATQPPAQRQQAAYAALNTSGASTKICLRSKRPSRSCAQGATWHLKTILSARTRRIFCWRESLPRGVRQLAGRPCPRADHRRGGARDPPAAGYPATAAAVHRRERPALHRAGGRRRGHHDRRVGVRPRHHAQQARRPELAAGGLLPARATSSRWSACPAACSTARATPEGAIALARLAGLQPVVAICELMNEEGHMARGEEVAQFAEKHGIPRISVQALVERVC
jgi:hypothetical protein